MRHPLAHAGFVLPCALVMVPACGGGEFSWAGTMTDSAGVMIVSNPSVGMWSPGEEWTVVEEVRIGVVEGDSDYVFGDVGGVTVDSHGRIFVLDVQAQHVKVFSPEGEYEQTIGGPGGGPGELADAYFPPAVGIGDTLLVPDARGNRRVNRFAPDGSSIGSFPMPVQDAVVLDVAGTRSGMAVLWARPFAFPGQPEPDRIDRILALSSDGSAVDTLLTFPSGRTFSMGGPSFELVIYAAEPAWEITEDSKLVFGVTDQSRLGIYSWGGRLERVIEKPVERRQITDRDKERYMGQVEQSTQEFLRFPEFYPCFNDVIVGPDQTIWVQHVRTISELTDGELETLVNTSYRVQRIITALRKFSGTEDWDVFDAEGRYLGVVTMPLRISLPAARGENIYGVWRDELDVQYVVRLRIVGDLTERGAP